MTVLHWSGQDFWLPVLERAQGKRRATCAAGAPANYPGHEVLRAKSFVAKYETSERPGSSQISIHSYKNRRPTLKVADKFIDNLGLHDYRA
jgi:hypothetical protein